MEAVRDEFRSETSFVGDGKIMREGAHGFGSTNWVGWYSGSIDLKRQLKHSDHKIFPIKYLSAMRTG